MNDLRSQIERPQFVIELTKIYQNEAIEFRLKMYHLSALRAMLTQDEPKNCVKFQIYNMDVSSEDELSPRLSGSISGSSFNHLFKDDIYEQAAILMEMADNPDANYAQTLWNLTPAEKNIGLGFHTKDGVVTQINMQSFGRDVVLEFVKNPRNFIIFNDKIHHSLHKHEVKGFEYESLEYNDKKYDVFGQLIKNADDFSYILCSTILFERT